MAAKTQNKTIRSEGKNVDEALKGGLAQLNLQEHQINYRVVQLPSTGFFGLTRSKPAIVEITPKDDSVPRKKEGEGQKRSRRKPNKEHAQKPKRNNGMKKQRSISDDGPQKKSSVPDVPPEESIQKSEALCKELFQKMKFDCAIQSGAEKHWITIDIESSESGRIIGKRGKTLNQIEFLINSMAGRMDILNPIVLDAEGFRGRREEALKKLVEKISDKVIRTGRSIGLEPMIPRERKILHMAFQDDGRVRTTSRGRGNTRKVVVSPRRED